MEFERDYFQDLPDDYREYFAAYKKYIQSVLEAVEVKVEIQKLIVKSGISIKTWSGIKAANQKRAEFNKACAECFDDGVEVNKIAQRLKEISQKNS